MQQRYGLVRDGVVREIIVVDAEDTPLVERLHPAIYALCLPIGEQVQPGWIASNGSFAAPAAVGLSPEDYRLALASYVNFAASQRNYESGVSCASYANSTNAVWAAEAAAFIAWRDAYWTAAYAIIAAVQGGAPAPTLADLFASLPELEWPEP